MSWMLVVEPSALIPTQQPRLLQEIRLVLIGEGLSECTLGQQVLVFVIEVFEELRYLEMS